MASACGAASTQPMAQVLSQHSGAHELSIISDGTHIHGAVIHICSNCRYTLNHLLPPPAHHLVYPSLYKGQTTCSRMTKSPVSPRASVRS